MDRDDATRLQPQDDATRLQPEAEDATRLAPTAPPDAAARRAAEADVPLEWHKGDVILDLYEVKQVFTSGGMGLVYRVHHRNWNIDLAVKSPRPEYFQTQTHKENFIREAETWVDLGLHPHTVSCYYVRTLGGIPCVFAEFVEGGSLSDWIRKRRLYEDGPEKALERILDVAIQFAWGLHYAHEQGLVHQDVKPANVMMTPDGVVKVTDFGLAKAHPVADVEVPDGRGGTHLVKGRGMTPAYCSPEQAAGQFLTRRTDIWSWGVSILEMFVGERTWMSGVAAPGVLEMYLEEGTEVGGLPPMPSALADLLRRCFQDNPEARPHDMQVVTDALQEIYHQEIGQPYRRQMPEAAELRADSLNNKALSLLDLEQEGAAEAAWEAALEADSHHAEATYNLGLRHWRTGRHPGDELVKHLEAVAATQEGAWQPQYLLGLVHLERGDGKAAERALTEAAQLAPEEREIQEALARVGEVQSVPCLLRIFEGHKGAVSAVAVTPDGRYVLSGSDDYTLRLWDLESGKCLRAFEGHTGGVRAVAVTSDGRYAVSGSIDETLRLWELGSGACLRTFEGHEHVVCAVAITPDGRYAVSGSVDKTLRLWDLESGECLHVFEGHENSVRAVTLSPDGRHAVSGSYDQTLRLWDLESRMCLRTLEGRRSAIRAAAITPDGRYVLSGDVDRALWLWDLASGRCLRTFEGHKSTVYAIAVTPDGRYILSCSVDTLRLWEIESGVCLRTLKGGGYSVVITPDGRYAVSGSIDRTLRLWRLELDKIGRGAGLWALSRPRSTLEVMRAAAAVQKGIDAARATLAQGRPTEAGATLRQARSVPGYERDHVLLELWHQAGVLGGRRVGLRAAYYLRTFEGHSDDVNAVAVTPDRRYALSASGGLHSRDTTLRLWNLDSGTCLRTLEGHRLSVIAVALTPDGRYAVSGSNDRTLRLWDLENGKCLRIFQAHKGGVDAVAITPDGHYIVSGDGNRNTVRLWDLESGKCLRTFEGHKSVVDAVALTPDGRYTVSGSWDKTLRLWDVESGRCRGIFKNKDEVGAVALTPDGRCAVSGSWDKTLRLWDLKSREYLRIFEGHKGRVNAVAITPDGRYAVSGSGDKTLRLWDLASGKCLHTFEGHKSVVHAVALTQDGRYVVSSSKDWTLRLWELDWDYEFPEPADWDEDARPYLEIFLTLHTPHGPDGISREGMPTWTEEDFQQLLTELGYRGYGWLRPEGVRRKLEEMATARR